MLSLLTRVSRIRYADVRIALLLLMFVPQMLRFAVGILWNAPLRLFSLSHWGQTLLFYGCALRGDFAGLPATR